MLESQLVANFVELDSSGGIDIAEAGDECRDTLLMEPPSVDIADAVGLQTLLWTPGACVGTDVLQQLEHALGTKLADYGRQARLEITSGNVPGEVTGQPDAEAGRIVLAGG